MNLWQTLFSYSIFLYSPVSLKLFLFVFSGEYIAGCIIMIMYYDYVMTVTA